MAWSVMPRTRSSPAASPRHDVVPSLVHSRSPDVRSRARIGDASPADTTTVDVDDHMCGGVTLVELTLPRNNIGRGRLRWRGRRGAAGGPGAGGAPTAGAGALVAGGAGAACPHTGTSGNDAGQQRCGDHETREIPCVVGGAQAYNSGVHAWLSASSLSLQIACDTPDHSCARFRLAVHAAHCASPSRAVRLLGDSAADHARRRRSCDASRSGSFCRAGRAACRRSGAPQADPRILELGVPALGICYGMQLMTDTLGGEVGRAVSREYGHATVTLSQPVSLFHELPTSLRVWASHGDFVAQAPAGFEVIATSANAPVAAMQHSGAPALRAAVPSGSRAYRARRRRSSGTSRSTSAAAAATGRWRRSSTRAIGRIRAQVGDGRVVCGLSGGVDSTVAAVLLHKALGDRLTCIFVDNGLLAAERSGAGSDAVRRVWVCRSSSSTRRICFSSVWRT